MNDRLSVYSTMIKRSLFCFFVITLSIQPVESFSQENNTPVLKIIAPQNKSSFPLNSSVQYRIKVSDKEDGESEYGEIATNEVFLEVRYLPDASSISTAATADPGGLATMKKSNCFNCHAFNGKLIAPSFYEIAKRYPSASVNIDLLTKRIREGSGGVWGTASMPSHSELTAQQAKEIANWILKNGRDENLNYYIGTEGAFKIKTPDGSNKGALQLSATYSDHGTKNNPQQSLSAKDVVIMSIK